MKQQIYSAGLYLRLSRDDDNGTGDSGSIQTQQMMLERYCREQNLPIHDLYIDDGYSGLNFERPAFQRMLEDIKAGKINLVITKDLSRLGRDYIQTGHYTELFFPQHGVRYIALNDGVDTLHDNNDIAPFKNILNDMYAKDLSRKVKSAKRARAAQGAFIGSHAPYGYRQSADNCNVLEINEETTPVVRRIYAMALSGKGAVTIAKTLREEQVLTPAAHKVAQGERHFAYLFEDGNEEKRYRWSYTTVHRILSDRVYLGHMISHKSQVVHYKTKQRSQVPRGEQIVVENTHPPLVTREDFDKVQLLIRTRRCPVHEEGANLFQALLYCDECGRRLSMATKIYKNSRIKFYRCMHHYHFPEECTGTHFIRFDDIYQVLFEDIQRIGELLKTHMDDLVATLSDYDGDIGNRAAQQEEALRKRLESIDAIVDRLYEDFGAGLTSLHNYNRLLAKYQKEQEEVLEKLNALPAKSDDTKTQEAKLQKLREAVEAHLDIQELTPPLLHELIQKVHVGQREKVDDSWVQDIRIEYRFAGEIPQL